jgi:hypothetical protein
MECKWVEKQATNCDCIICSLVNDQVNAECVVDVGKNKSSVTFLPDSKEYENQIYNLFFLVMNVKHHEKIPVLHGYKASGVREGKTFEFNCFRLAKNRYGLTFSTKKLTA